MGIAIMFVLFIDKKKTDIGGLYMERASGEFGTCFCYSDKSVNLIRFRCHPPAFSINFIMTSHIDQNNFLFGNYQDQGNAVTVGKADGMKS